MKSESLLSSFPGVELRRRAAESGIQSPHAFVRGINVHYDLDVHLDTILRPLPADDDFRISHGNGKDERWVLLERLPWDSEFFSRGIARLNAVISPNAVVEIRDDISPTQSAIQASLEAARGGGVDYVTCTVAATDLPMIRSLCASGFDLIETRCHYHMKLVAAPAERYATRPATRADIPSLAKAAREMVNRFDRFHADPAIAPADADRLMEKWIEASVLDGFADVTVVPDVATPHAFCTAKYHREHWQGWGLNLAQPVLSAVSPVHRGWYVRIISELNEHLRSIGAEHSFLITQITNNAVIRCWEKLGYQYGKGEHVFRKLL